MNYRHYTFSLLLICTSVLNIQAQQNPAPPFTIELELVDAPLLPGIHSFAKAQSSDKWLIVSGRVDGLHSFYPNSAFAPAEANQMIYVIDTNDWQVWSAPLQVLPYTIRASLSATNTEFYQAENRLYIAGGYGYDSLTDSKITFPTLTVLEVDEVINEIINGGTNLSPLIRQISDTTFAVTGGALNKIGTSYFLAGGHNFAGLYTKLPSSTFVQTYTNRITSFNIADDGTNLTVSNFQHQVDTDNFHRRDLNLAPFIYPDGSDGLVMYGGVFRQDKNLPFLHPVYIKDNFASTDYSFEQRMSQYTCPILPVYDSATQTMHTTFFGGISLYDHIDSLNQVLEDTLVPFINDITTLSRSADGNSIETILSAKFPGLSGANADFFPALNLPGYANGVIKLSQINSKRMMGYIYGGINSNKPNEGYTNASNQLFRVFLTPSIGTYGEYNFAHARATIFPNPSIDHTQLEFTLAATQRISVRVLNVYGKVVLTFSEQEYAAGVQQLKIITHDLPVGIYAVLMSSEMENLGTHKFIVAR